MSHEFEDHLSDNLRSINVNNFEYKQEVGTGDVTFDEIIGHIEDLLMEEEFQNIQQKFLDKYWETFEPVDENKLIYMEIFNEYNKTIESYIDQSLTKSMPEFSMESFLNQLSKKSTELEGEVFEVLSTFTDFMAFKEMFLDYRAVKEGKVQDFSAGILITSVNATNSNSDGSAG